MSDELTADCPHCEWSEKIDPADPDPVKKREAREETHQRYVHTGTVTVQVTLEREFDIHQTEEPAEYSDFAHDDWEEKDTGQWDVAFARAEQTKDPRGADDD